MIVPYERVAILAAFVGPLMIALVVMALAWPVHASRAIGK
jgi:hypothetical protein